MRKSMGWRESRESRLGGAKPTEPSWLRGTLQGGSGDEPSGAGGRRDRQHHARRDWWWSWGRLTQVFLSCAHGMESWLKECPVEGSLGTI